MSWEAVSWVAKIKVGGPGRKATLLALANCADQEGRCYPSQTYIAEVSEQSARTVRQHLSELEDMRIITREARRTPTGGFTSDIIQINMNQRQILPAAESADGTICRLPAAESATKSYLGESKNLSPARARVVPLHPDGDLIPCPQPVEPNKTTRDYVAAHAGIREIDPLVVAEFSSKQRGKPRMLTAEGWQGELAKWLIHEKRVYEPTRKAQNDGRSGGSYGAHRGRARGTEIIGDIARAAFGKTPDPAA